MRKKSRNGGKVGFKLYGCYALGGNKVKEFFKVGKETGIEYS